MKDQVFSGKDVAEAVRAASRALGLPEQGLRYVVLAPGGEGAFAQIAVMLDAQAAADRPVAVPAPRPAPARPADPRARIRRVLRELAEAANLAIDVNIDEGPDTITVELVGEGATAFLEEGGQPLKSLEHLLQRMFGRELEPARLFVACQGFREARDGWIRDEALALAREVRADGKPRTMEALNAYERRVVHVALGDEPGVQTYSVGEGQDRRVVIALSDVPEP